MKKGISLIVLVITIIVLAILAGAIIISLSNTNIIEETNKARNEADLANAKATVQMAYAEAVMRGKADSAANTENDGKAYNADGDIMDAADYKAALTAAGFKNVDVYTIDVDATSGLPKSVTSSYVPAT